MDKRRMIIGVMVGLIFSLAVPFLAKATDGDKVFHWTKEGVSPFWGKPLRSEADLKALFNDEAFKSKQRKNLKIVEPGWDTKEIVRLAEVAVMNGEAQRVTIAPGSSEAEFDWMLYGSSGKTAATLWNGGHNLSGFLVPIVYQGENIDLFYANACVNVLKKKRQKKVEVIPGEYGLPQQRRTVVVQPQQEEEEEIVVVQQPQPRKKIVYVVVQAPATEDYSESYSQAGYGTGFPFTPPPLPIFGGYSGGYGSYGYSGGYSGGRGRGGYGRSGSGRQAINIYNSNTNTSSSSSYSRATGGRVNFSSSINNRQGQRQGRSGGSSSNICPPGQPARR